MKYFLSFVFISMSHTAQVSAQTAIKTIFLVRHAEKAEDIKGDRDPDLNETGLRRAENLARILSDADIEYIYSTDFKRTRETGLPLSKINGKEIVKYDSREPGFLNKILAETGEKRVLIIGHSNTVPEMVNELTGEDKYSFLDENEYDKLFIISLSQGNSDCVIIK